MPVAKKAGAAGAKKAPAKKKTAGTASKTAKAKAGSASSKLGAKGKAGAKSSKAGALLKGKKGKAKEKEEPKWTPEQKAAAVTIQSRFKGFKARKDFVEQKAKKAQMEEEMEMLRRQAYQAEVEYERKQAAKRRQAQMEEAKRRKAEAKMRKDLLEAAYDGENEDLEELMEKGRKIFKDVVEVADANNNTMLSEAAAGGHAATIRLLLERAADPNVTGEFGRSPLWRACFLGHEETMQALLKAGADPRIPNEMGEQPVHVANSAAMKEALEGWDTARTDKLVAERQATLELKKLKLEEEAAAEIADAQSGVDQAQEEYEGCQRQLKHAHVELEKRITEHDTCVGEGKGEELIKVTLQHIHEQEENLANAKKAAAAALEKLQMAKFALREKESKDGEEEELPGEAIKIKDLDDVLLKDIGNKVRDSGKWPLVWDASGQSGIFLRYIDSNYVNAVSKALMEPNKLRRSILGAMRYGKPFVLDLMDVNIWDEVQRDMDLIQFELMDKVLDQSILNEKVYLSLVRQPGDGEEYEAYKFQEAKIREKFKVIFLCSGKSPPPADLLAKTFPFRVVVKN